MISEIARSTLSDASALAIPERVPKNEFDRISRPVGIFCSFGVVDKRETHIGLSGIEYVDQSNEAF
jgi:hypothetical protein